MVAICSFNCNGLKSINNFEKCMSLIDDRKFGIVFLQETFWNDDYIEGIKHLYDGDIYYSNGLNNRQGVAILVKNCFKNRVNFVHKDNEGRFIHVEYEENNILFNFISIYAPNINGDRVIFFEYVEKYIHSLENVIMGGDFNTTLCSLDRGSKTKHIVDEPCRNLFDIIENNHLYDVWRTRNMHSRIFSWKRVTNDNLQQSRIDYFLISSSLSSFVQNIYYNVTSLSDHSLVVMHLNCCNIERGPGLWILNNTLLNNEDYVKRVKEMIIVEKESELYTRDIVIWWDNLKYKIKKFSQVLSSRLAKESRQEYYRLQNQINIFCDRTARGIDVDVAKFESLKLELSDYENEKCKGAILRSKAVWAVESDKNTKYFLNLEKYKQENNSIKELLNSKNEIVSDTDGILELQYSFYKDLYSCVETDSDKMVEFLESVDKKVDDNECITCDSDILPEEIFKAMSQMSKNKSPGSDGLTVEFYCKFYDDLKEILSQLFNAIEKEGELSRSMKCGILSVFYKKKGDRKSLRNYRPISLLQVDYKILARVMANRFKHVLPNIISEDQTCCILGRDISNNIANVRDVIDLVEQDNLEGYIVKIDQEKAFDRVSHVYLLEVLRKFGFGDRFVKWIEIFYNGISSAVKCNGFLSKYFYVQNGIRQGCPISALLYVLAAEPLHSRIMQNDNIQGICIPNSSKKGLIYQHADDTTLSVSNKKSISESFIEFDLYSKASGAKINKQKSEILCIGKGVLSDNEKEEYGLEVCENNIQLLGVFIGKDKKLCEEMNWKSKIDKIKCLLNMWLQRHLTIQGRVTIVNSLMMSRFWYILFVTPLPEWAHREIMKMCVNFIWKNKAHLVKYNSIIDLKDYGGLQFADIKCKMYAFRLKFLGRLVDDEYNVLWKYTFKYFMSKIYNMNLGLNALYTKIPICEFRSAGVPTIYQEMFQALYVLKDKIDFQLSVENIYDQPLFCNPRIVDVNKTLLFHDFILAGLISLKDICYEVKTGFLPDIAIAEMVQDVCENVDVNFVISRYHKLLCAIPDDWKRTVNTDVHNTNIHRTIDICIENRNVLCNLSMYSSKKLYQCILEMFSEKPTGIVLWKNLFNIEDVDFINVWHHVNMYWKPVNMTELDYKILHNCLFTKVKLQKIGLTDNDLCSVCGIESEDILHMFLNCDELDEFLDYISGLITRCFENCNSDKVSQISSEQLLFLGLRWSLKGVNDYFVNFLMSTVRLCIYKRRNLVMNGHRNVNLTKLFQYTLKHYVSYFYVYMCQHNQYKRIFEERFVLYNPLVEETNSVIVFKL